ncbi:MAG: hypothetical protein O3A63_11755 [Proteobacteria bacterium]|nr:hypothetical protein [Pseudomonadota bacterium]
MTALTVCLLFIGSLRADVAVLPDELAEPDRESSGDSIDDSKEDLIALILEDVFAEESYREETLCLSNNMYRKIEMLDEHHVLFSGRGERVWVNRLRNRCTGINRNNIMIVEAHGSRICDMDRLSFQERYGIEVVSPACWLGPFEEIDPTHAEALKEALRQAKNTLNREAS